MSLALARLNAPSTAKMAAADLIAGLGSSRSAKRNLLGEGVGMFVVPQRSLAFAPHTPHRQASPLGLRPPLDEDGFTEAAGDAERAGLPLR